MAELNLVPFKVKQKKAMDIRKKHITTGLCIILGIMVLIYAVPTITLMQLKRADARLANEISAKAKVKASNTTYRNQIENYSNYIQKCNAVKNSKIIAETKIKGVQKYMPSNVVCTSVSYNMLTLELNGTADSYNSVCEFVANLQMAHLYNEARINSITSNNDAKANTFKFSIVVTY